MIRRANFWGCIMLIFALCTTGCNKRKTLSDKELAQIFRDAFLTNAYVTSQGLHLDSLRIYEPIFQSYGYTTDDVQYTIGSFSTRKSARLGDVVEQAIAMLESEGLALDHQVAILDTIDNIAQRRSIQTILSQKLIEMNEWEDTTKIVFTLKGLSAGSYSIDFDYRIDSTSSVSSYKFVTWLESRNHDYSFSKSSSNMSQLSAHGAQHMNRSVRVTPHHDQMIVQLAVPQKYDDKSTTEMPALTIKNLTIRHIPSIEESAGKSFAKLVPIRVFNDSFYYETPQNSL